MNMDKPKKLIDLIRETRWRRAGVAAEDEMEVVVIRYFSEEPLPYTPGKGRTELLQALAEPFESFEARVVAAAKASGARFAVIRVSEIGKSARAVLVNDSALQKNIEQMTDAELVVLASGCGVLREMNDADLAAISSGGVGQ
jgi:hypothetical protein